MKGEGAELMLTGAPRGLSITVTTTPRVWHAFLRTCFGQDGGSTTRRRLATSAGRDAALNGRIAL